MSDENRNRLSPIPGNLKEVLTELQLQALRHIEGFGWDLCFVRRHNVAEPIAVVSDPTGKTIGVLEADGRVNLEHKLRIRP